MNIEEAIKVVRNIKTLRCKECVFDNDTKCIKENGKDCQDIAIETLLTAYEEKCKELKKEIKDDLDVRNRWGLTLQELEKEKEKNKEAKNLLIDMVNQFAYDDNKHERLCTGGLSTLEDAFYFLDIDEGIKREDLWNLKEE